MKFIFDIVAGILLLITMTWSAILIFNLEIIVSAHGYSVWMPTATFGLSMIIFMFSFKKEMDKIDIIKNILILCVATIVYYGMLNNINNIKTLETKINNISSPK